MGYDNDPNMDENGEPLMHPDALSDRGPSPRPVHYEDGENGWRRERSPTPVLESAAVEDNLGEPRKRLVKKGGDSSGTGTAYGGQDLDDWENEPSTSKKRKGGLKERKVGGGGRGNKDRKRLKSERVSTRSSRLGSKGYGEESEIKELWDTIAGGDSEGDNDGVRNAADDAFIDDSGVDPADRCDSDNDDRYLKDVPQAEKVVEDDEIDRLLKVGKKKKKIEPSSAEIYAFVENIIAELEVAAEEDAELNKQHKPAINKLKKLPLLTEVLSKRNLQGEFLDHGVLTVLKKWLEPLPDGSLPNMNIRAAILNILTDFPIDLHQYDRKEQLKKSGLGKVIMFLSKTDEGTISNRRLAKDLVDNWSRPIFNKSTRFEDMRTSDELVPDRKLYIKRVLAIRASGLQSQEDGLDEFSLLRKTGKEAGRVHASRPEALALDFVVRPQSKIDPEEIRARAKRQVQDQQRLKMNKKMQQLKAQKRKQLQASKLSAEGRRMIKYL